MALFFYAMAILAIIGGLAIIYWVRKSEETEGSCTMIGMAVLLLAAGIGMIAMGWVYR